MFKVQATGNKLIKLYLNSCVISWSVLCKNTFLLFIYLAAESRYLSGVVDCNCGVLMSNTLAYKVNSYDKHSSLFDKGKNVHKKSFITFGPGLFVFAVT
jgi:hypothetical protein